MVGGPAEVVGQHEALIRTVLAAARNLPAGTLVVPVPYAERDAAATRELAAIANIAAAYGATHLMADRWHDHAARAAEETGAPVGGGAAPVGVGGAPIPVLHSGDWAYGPRAAVWRPLSRRAPGDAIAGRATDHHTC